MSTTDKKLTPKERRFCEEYLRTGNKEQSVIAAGYSAKNLKAQAEKLLKRDSVTAFLNNPYNNIGSQDRIDENWAVTKAIEVYNRSMQEVPVKKWDSGSKSMVETGEYTFDPKSALKALELIKSLLCLGDGRDDDKITASVTFVDDLGGGRSE